MKVIDLLNKIANGEDVPKKIKVLGVIYYYCGKDISGNCYYSEPEGSGGIRLSFNTAQLNDTVEIIEEDKKIEKIDMFDYFTGYDFDNTSIDLRKHLEVNFQTLNNIINEIIDYINGSDKE